MKATAKKQRQKLPRVCPECGHVFGGDGWKGIDEHWRTYHEDVMPYKEFKLALRHADHKKAPRGNHGKAKIIGQVPVEQH